MRQRAGHCFPFESTSVYGEGFITRFQVYQTEHRLRLGCPIDYCYQNKLFAEIIYDEHFLLPRNARCAPELRRDEGVARR